MKRLILALVISVILFSAYLSEAQISKDSLYKIGVNDVIRIRVLDHDDLLSVVSVSSDGMISFPYLGTVHVEGMSIVEIEQEITKRLSEGFVKNPVVTVSLERSMSRKVFTYGSINRRGEILYEQDMTLLQALSLAGGLTQDGIYGKLKVRRKQKASPGYKDIVINLDSTIENSNIKDMILLPDDIIIVEQNKTFLMQGEISLRGRTVLENDMTVLRALLQAGGVTESGRYGKIIVRRKMGGESGEYKEIAGASIIDGIIGNREVEDMLLKPDDILIVERSKTFLIQGEVSSRGRVILESGMTVLGALLQAGGVTENARYGKITIRRKKTGETVEYTNVAEAKLNDGVIEDNKVEDLILEPDDILIVDKSESIFLQGEVSSRGRVILESGMTVLSALLQAGGVTENAKYGKIIIRRKTAGETVEYSNVAEAELNDGVIEDHAVEEMILRPDDILFVERNGIFYIYGEVNKTGEGVLKNDMTVFQAITIAGGFTKWGSGSRVKILRPRIDGIGFETLKVNIKDVLDGDASADIYLKHGDIIVVSTGIF